MTETPSPRYAAGTRAKLLAGKLRQISFLNNHTFRRSVDPGPRSNSSTEDFPDPEAPSSATNSPAESIKTHAVNRANQASPMR